MLSFAISAVVTLNTAPMPLEFEGMYVEGCSCMAPCPCELTGLAMGCEGVGAFSFGRGKFNGADISGVKMAYATAPGDWVVGYVDAPSEAKRKAGAALCKAAFGAWGKMGDVKSAKISITGSKGNYILNVNNGAVMTLKTEPTLGGNKMTPITYSNINSVLHPTVMQANAVSCTFNDEGHKFEIHGRNGYFNSSLKVNGKL